MTAGDDGLDETTELALAAAEGDPIAQSAFVKATQTDVWRFTAALVDPGVADDLTQETYLRAFRSLSAFEGRSSVRTWLLGIARRTCADHLRAVIRRRRLDARLAAQAWTDIPVPDPAYGVRADSGHGFVVRGSGRGGRGAGRHDPVAGGAGARRVGDAGRGGASRLSGLPAHIQELHRKARTMEGNRLHRGTD
jgi:RNA polymerase sigma factor (sigma-70 family)